MVTSSCEYIPRTDAVPARQASATQSAWSLRCGTHALVNLNAGPESQVVGVPWAIMNGIALDPCRSGEIVGKVVPSAILVILDPQ